MRNTVQGEPALTCDGTPGLGAQHVAFFASVRGFQSTVVGEPSRRFERVNELESSVIPLLASPQGGVAARPKKYTKHPLIARPGWFSNGNKRKTTPAASGSVAAKFS